MMGEVHLSQPVQATFPARVDAIDPPIHAASDTFRVRLLLPNPGNAIPAGIQVFGDFAGCNGRRVTG